MSDDEYMDAIRNRLGLRPPSAPMHPDVNERYWIYLDREGQPHHVRKPFNLTPAQRKAAYEALKRQVDPFNQLQ
jgi:hypothetical protein